LVQYTERLFERLKIEERKRAEIWAQATQNLSITEDDDARSFYLKVVSENNTIPAIIVDEQNRINYITNVDTAGMKMASTFSGKVKNEFTRYKPIIIDDGFSNNYYIYYQDSRVFIELREVLDNIIKSFISEVVVNSASVPVIVADSSSTKIIASGNLSNALSTDTTAMLKLTKNMSGDNTPFIID
jgi:glutaredoxin